MDNSLSQSLRNARNFLTKETWAKGNYFKAKNGNLCACAHGAVQRETNSVVRERILSFQNEPTVSTVDVDRVQTATRARAAIDARHAEKAAAIASGARSAASVAVESRDAIYDMRNTPIKAAREAATEAKRMLNHDALELSDIAEPALSTDAANEGNRASAGISHEDEVIINLFQQRPEHVRSEYVYLNKNYGNTNASYLLGLVGLTAKFNDAKDTTLEMVHAKFDRAIRIAEMMEA